MILKGDGWNNHEESFEETLRREMLAARQELWLIKMDLKEHQKAHYKLLKRNAELIEEVIELKKKQCTCDD
tara:strand:+ start:730 stop:942 length:213 start_codon:yes stop_codon:yes gene_type:complete